MKIEVGIFYKTRAGDKVRIYAIDGVLPSPIHGAISKHGIAAWTAVNWTKNGRIYHLCEDNSDIISEWEEPKPKQPVAIWAVMRIDYTLHSYWNDEAEALEFAVARGYSIVKYTAEFDVPRV